MNEILSACAALTVSPRVIAEQFPIELPTKRDPWPCDVDKNLERLYLAAELYLDAGSGSSKSLVSGQVSNQLNKDSLQEFLWLLVIYVNCNRMQFWAEEVGRSVDFLSSQDKKSLFIEKSLNTLVGSNARTPESAKVGLSALHHLSRRWQLPDDQIQRLHMLSLLRIGPHMIVDAESVLSNVIDMILALQSSVSDYISVCDISG